MRLNLKTDYCLKVLMYLQEHEGRTKIQVIADKYGISKNHLSVAVNNLSDLGYIISTTGPSGGIEFNPKFANKTVAELVTKIEDMSIVECFKAETNTCALSPSCKLKSILKKATKAFVKELGNYKIKDLA